MAALRPGDIVEYQSMVLRPATQRGIIRSVHRAGQKSPPLYEIAAEGEPIIVLRTANEVRKVCDANTLRNKDVPGLRQAPGSS